MSKVGQVLYRVVTDESNGTVETWEYRVRTIRGGKAYATLALTHVTTNSKGEWLDGTVPDWCRIWWYDPPRPDTYVPGRWLMPRPDDLCNTKKAAARAALKLHRVGDFEDEAMGEKVGRTLKRMAA